MRPLAILPLLLCSCVTVIQHGAPGTFDEQQAERHAAYRSAGAWMLAGGIADAAVAGVAIGVSEANKDPSSGAPSLLPIYLIGGIAGAITALVGAGLYSAGSVDDPTEGDTQPVVTHTATSATDSFWGVRPR